MAGDYERQSKPDLAMNFFFARIFRKKKRRRGLRHAAILSFILFSKHRYL